MGAEASCARCMRRPVRRARPDRMFRADFTIMLYEGAIQLVGVPRRSRCSSGSARCEVLSGDLTIGELVAFNALVALANGPIILLLVVGRAPDGTRAAQPAERHLRAGARAGRGPLRAARRCARSRGGIRSRTSASATAGRTRRRSSRSIDLEVEPGDDRRASSGAAARARRRWSSASPGCSSRPRATILYDGVDLTHAATTATLRRQIGFVLQENYLFDDTIARNIAFGDDEPDMEQRRLGRAHGQRARLHRAAAARLRDQGRRERAAPVRRPAPAHRDRPRASTTSRRS